MVKHRKEVEGLATWIERHICLPETVYITAGCDVQEDRLETTIVGHGRDGTSSCSAIKPCGEARAVADPARAWALVGRATPESQRHHHYYDCPLAGVGVIYSQPRSVLTDYRPEETFDHELPSLGASRCSIAFRAASGNLA
jgi:Terminase large subunit gpA, endonuclease domain